MGTIFTFCMFAITMTAFVFGEIRLFRKGKPLYFQILIGAIGCSALGQLSYVVTYFCGTFDSATYMSAGVFADIACFSLLLCANVGALNRVVTEGVTPRATRIAVIAPILYTLLNVWLLSRMLVIDPISGVFIILLIPIADVCSFLNLRHLFSKPDAMGFLPGIRGCDIFTLAFLFLNIINLLVYSYFDGTVVAYLSDVSLSLALLGLSISADKGAKAWAI